MKNVKMTNAENIVVCIIIALLVIIGFLVCRQAHRYLQSHQTKPATSLEIAQKEAKMLGGILLTNSVVFECDFYGDSSAKVYCFQHHGKDHYVAISRFGGIAIK